jgi:EAL domain-containing protein (putative c-di-GMP-specific phosphodiesterase class I)
LSNSGAPPETTLSVNVSADELHAEGAVDDWRLACSEQDVPTSRVMFEITESSALADTPVNLAALARLRIHGFKLAIDDIGMGFSSLGRLMRQPFSALKLDSSFIRELRGSADARKIVRSLLDLGNSLGLRTIAEGVEEPGDLTWLRDSGCQCAQGFLIARPMPAEACEKWLLDGHIGLPHARGKRRAVSNKSIPGVAHER